MGQVSSITFSNQLSLLAGEFKKAAARQSDAKLRSYCNDIDIGKIADKAAKGDGRSRIVSGVDSAQIENAARAVKYSSELLQRVKRPGDLDSEIKAAVALCLLNFYSLLMSAPPAYVIPASLETTKQAYDHCASQKYIEAATQVDPLTKQFPPLGK